MHPPTNVHTLSMHKNAFYNIFLGAENTFAKVFHYKLGMKKYNVYTLKCML